MFMKLIEPQQERGGRPPLAEQMNAPGRRALFSSWTTNSTSGPTGTSGSMRRSQPATFSRSPLPEHQELQRLRQPDEHERRDHQRGDAAEIEHRRQPNAGISQADTKPASAPPAVNPTEMQAMNVTRSRLGLYSPISAVAFGMMQPRPIPAMKRTIAVAAPT